MKEKRAQNHKKNPVKSLSDGPRHPKGAGLLGNVMDTDITDSAER
jgi:hypothetical protein